MADPLSDRRRVRSFIAVIGAAAAILCFSSCTSEEAGPAGASSGSTTLTVFAAASLRAAFTELEVAFEAANPSVDVKLSTGGSGALAGQILNGAPADVFAAADETTMAKVVDTGLAAEPAVFATNTLNIVVPASNPQQITSLSDLTRAEVIVAVGAQGVPVGDYARTVFSNAKLSIEPDTLEQTTSSIVTKAALGEIDAGIVYVTDTLNKDEVRSIAIDPSVNVTARYPVAALKQSAAAEQANAFVSFLITEPATAVLKRYGFGTP